MCKTSGPQLKVWFWFGRDRVSLQDLEFLVACSSRSEIQKHSVRLRLPKPHAGHYSLVKRDNDGRVDLALGRPGHVFWRDSEVSPAWRSEDDLDEVRRSSRAWQAGAGTPLHRPDPL